MGDRPIPSDKSVIGLYEYTVWKPGWFWRKFGFMTRFFTRLPRKKVVRQIPIHLVDLLRIRDA